MKDFEFIRGKVPMTKEEVRTLALSKLELTSKDVVMDIGSGTGSITIEAAKRVVDGHVIALEHKEEALVLIELNKKKHSCDNLEIRASKAPHGFHDIDTVDKIFVGGSGGNLLSILNKIYTDGKREVKIVVSAILLDTFYESYSFFQEKEYDVEVIQVCINKIDPSKSAPMLLAQNPIFLITAQRK